MIQLPRTDRIFWRTGRISVQKDYAILVQRAKIGREKFLTLLSICDLRKAGNFRRMDLCEF